jgi:hypothetical protein
MQDTRLPKKALQYRPSGKRDIGRPKKRWRDQCEYGTGKCLIHGVKKKKKTMYNTTILTVVL